MPVKIKYTFQKEAEGGSLCFLSHTGMDLGSRQLITALFDALKGRVERRNTTVIILSER